MNEIKDLWRFLWTHKPILIVLVLLIAVAIYLWWTGGGPAASGGTQGTDTTPVDTGQGSGVPGVVTPNMTTTGQPVVQTSSIDQVQPTLTPNWFSILPVPFLSPTPLNTPTPASANVGPRTYTVVAGDTLRSVAKKVGKTPNQLYNDNRGTISLASSKHGGPYWDTGKATKTPPANVKLYSGTILSF